MATVFGSCRSINESNSTIQLCESVVEMSCGIETLEEGVFHYTPSMVPVQAFNTGEGKKYIVEGDMIEKLASYEDMSIAEAFSAVCDENGLMESDVYVLASDPTYAMDEATDAILGADDDDDITMYENTLVTVAESAKAYSDAGINVLYRPLCEELTSVTPSIKTFLRVCKANYWMTNKADFKKNVESAISSCSTYEDYTWVKRYLQRVKNVITKKHPDEESGFSDGYSELNKYLDSKIDQCQKLMKKYEDTSKRNIKDAAKKAKDERKRNEKQEKLQRKLARAKTA